MTLGTKARLANEAKRLGFSAFAVGPASLPGEKGGALDLFLAAGWQGDMTWLAERASWRRDPTALWPEAKSAIVVAESYAPGSDPLENLTRPEVGNISVYARNRDYHDALKPRLKTLARLAQSLTSAAVKVFVDTAPVMEKPVAQQAGLGWQGKHTNLLSRDLGNWFFLGVVLLAAELPADPPAKENCGSCQRCLDICPTKAFPKPFQLDARRCISYLTIEHKGPIDPDLRALIGNRIYGCDDCLAVCPWNKFAQLAASDPYRARPELEAPLLAELVKLDDASFRKLFAKSPIKRIGRARFLRNVLIAIANSNDETFLPAVTKRLDDEAALVRGAAVWALLRLKPQAAQALSQERMALESDPDVLAEWCRVTSGR